MTAGSPAHGSGSTARPPEAVSDEADRHVVVVNHEEQYSIWPSSRQLPAGWLSTGFTGSRAECLDHVAGVWTDMRPASLR